MISFHHDPVVTDALNQWRGREVFPTDMSSADLRGFSRELRERAVFSARTTNADYLAEVARVVDEMQSGKIDKATGRWHLMRKLKELGYDPERGFPADLAQIPPAERGSLQDLSSERRINLMLETNVRMATNYGVMVAGNGDYARYAYPAWELIRIYTRKLPRGSAESESPGWEERWARAGESVHWEGACQSPMVALKDSPIWPALGDGVGGYQDALGNPYPPYAFGSGKGWRATPRARCVALKLVNDREIPAPMQGTLAPDTKEVAAVWDRMPPDLAEALRKELLAA